MEFAHITPSRGRLTVLASAALWLAACGGGTDSGPQGGSALAAPPAIQGTVASGNPVANAVVTATDVNGKTATATADTNGNFTLVTSALTAPVALVATDPSAQVSPMVSVLASLPTAGQTATSNVTTLTTALSALLTSDGNPLDFVTPGAATTLNAVTGASVTAATGTLDTYLSNLLAATGLPANFDPVGTPFTANHSGADALIDMVSVVPEGAVTYLVYKTPTSAASQKAAYLTLNNTSTAANVPVAPTVSSGTVAALVSLQTYLGTLPAALQSCGAAGGTGAACSGLIDASYLENGFTNITQYNTDLSSSSLNLNGSVPVVVSVNSAGTSALIGIPYGLSSASGSNGQYTLYTTVQQTPSGTWDIIGNQLPYNLSVSTRTTYRNFLDTYTDPATGNPDVPFFDAGVNLSVGSLGTGHSGANISFVNVTGPGLPGGTTCNPAATSASSPCGLWLAKDSSGDMNLLSTAPSTALTRPPTSGISGTSEYRWSWAPSSYTPPASVGYWISGGTPINLSTLPPQAVYQFTLYNSSGTSLGTYSVTNPNSFADATLGQNAYNAGYFPVLGSDVTATFLTATGSLAGQQTSMSVDFTPPPANSPLTTTGVFIQSRDNNNCDVESSNVPVLPGVTSATVTAPAAKCGNGTAMAFWAINSTADPAFRIVQLKSKNASGVLFYLNQTVRSSSSAKSAS
ncbi:carboxypeptidase-like regulatory domain-containing protein [Burkholderia paludis]|uniref:carboxypeptidase-like regulatory domain-containing protein n=1 Tax=Burkholderia paludis TaxID=1506587 RepID=UPI0012699649|nr:carboxypeptidase-like regulatory domain-containing protein [Burkholderia paludis]